MCSHVADFNARNKSLTAKLLQQGYRYRKLRKTFSKFYRRYYELVSKFSVGLKNFCIKAYRNRNFMVTEYKNSKKKKKKKIEGRADFSDQFRKIVVRYKCIGYNINIMRQSACLCLTQSRLITLLPSLIARRWVGRQTQWWPRHKAIYFSWLGPELFCPLLGPPGFNCWFSFASVFQWVVRHPRDLQVPVATRFCRVLISVSS